MLLDLLLVCQLLPLRLLLCLLGGAVRTAKEGGVGTHVVPEVGLATV